MTHLVIDVKVMVTNNLQTDLDIANLTALDSVSRPKDSSEVPGFRLERVLS